MSKKAAKPKKQVRARTRELVKPMDKGETVITPAKEVISFRPAAPPTVVNGHGSTALTLPNNDPKVDKLTTASGTLLAKAKALNVSDEPTCAAASEGLVVIKNALNEAEERRKFFVKPIKDHAKNIDALFKRITEPLEEADRMLRNKVVAYRSSVLQAAEAEKAKLLDAAVEAKEQGDESSSLALTVQAESVSAPSKHLNTGGLGTVSTKKVWTFEVTDPLKVPRQYLEVNETAIRRAVNSGLREIPGVRIYSTEQLSVGGMDPSMFEQ